MFVEKFLVNFDHATCIGVRSEMKELRSFSVSFNSNRNLIPTINVRAMNFSLMVPPIHIWALNNLTFCVFLLLFIFDPISRNLYTDYLYIMPIKECISILLLVLVKLVLNFRYRSNIATTTRKIYGELLKVDILNTDTYLLKWKLFLFWHYNKNVLLHNTVRS